MGPDGPVCLAGPGPGDPPTVLDGPEGFFAIGIDKSSDSSAASRRCRLSFSLGGGPAPGSVRLAGS